MKLPRLRIHVSDEQQLALAILLVILVAVSFLYCLGFASLVLRENWDKAPLPWDEAPPSSGMHREGGSEAAVGPLVQVCESWREAKFAPVHPFSV